jgi:hypothetical protein
VWEGEMSREFAREAVERERRKGGREGWNER